MVENDHYEVSGEDLAHAAQLFDQFWSAQTQKTVLGYFRQMCEKLRLRPTNFPQFFPRLKSKLKSWKAQSLWTKIEKRASHRCYAKGKACINTRKEQCASPAGPEEALSLWESTR
ncbi:unnamed protein product [Notodromas monacha]|uniref:Uncharacterized protein n=1 Tax=Notodromas monacha TaxID=399045 RepID=A0A7R9GKX7_9CRUS|nr:unnamed protein product [Notodromas monacha]CAG0924360.1 unnamed protein product [Notodromas monacha]